MGASSNSRMRRAAGVLAAFVTVLACLALASTGTASAVQTPQSGIVSADPANWTPDVLSGRVNTIAQVGNTIYLGGLFSQVRSADGATTVNRTNLVAFDATNGTIRPWNPATNGEVEVIIPAADGTSVYVGGQFSSIAGTSGRVARLNATTGAPVAGFVAPTLNGNVKDLRLVGNRLWVSGAFTHVAGVPQAALATINATTGARDPYMGLAIAGVHNGGTTTVMKIDVTPDGSRLFAIGNFLTFDGQSRRQAAALDLTGPAAAVANWQTDFYSSTCSNSFNSYMRDLDISPDGSFLVISTTGAYGGTTKSCDSTARWETGAQGTGLRPSWIDYTGGDTTYAVAITGNVVYTGGHARWQNNPFAGDKPGAGAVSRPGIAALDATNGLPLSWNPTRTRGVGVFDLLATSQGLWVGSDTDRIGDYELHARIAFFPLAGGMPMPANFAGQLPGRAFLLSGSTSADATTVRTRTYDGTAAGATTTIPNGGIDWSRTRGAVMIDSTLYTGWSDGTFLARSFDGQHFGAATAVNTSDLLTVDSAWHTDVRTISGMAFDGGRLYYTVAGQSNLYYRYFTPESGVVGAQRFVASGNVSGIAFNQVTGMFIAGNRLYWATSDGVLRRIDFRDGAPVAGTAAAVSGPAIDGTNWASKGLFLYAGVAVVPNQAPTAVAGATCNGVDCAVTSVGSVDPDGTIAAYAWDFGDGGTAAGPTAQHSYAASGTYTITLTVTDDDGATAQATRSVTVVAPNRAPTASAAASCAALSCAFDGTGSVDPDGTVVGYAWNFGDGATATTATATHAYAAAGTYTATLTVTDDRGATASATTTVSVATAAANIRFVDAASTNANATTLRLTVPATVAAGDGLILFASTNSPTAALSAPTGANWQEIGTQSTSGVLTRAWRVSAGPTTAGTTIEVTSSVIAKVDLTLLAYRGTAADPVAAHAEAVETTATTSHATPAATVAGNGAWVVSYWAHKDSTSTSLTAGAGVTARSADSGTGGGHVTVLAGDSGAAVAAGTVPARTATTQGASQHATMWTLVLAPA